MPDDAASSLEIRRLLAEQDAKVCNLDSLLWARSFVERPRGILDARFGECLALLGHVDLLEAAR
jgi:hypothetical protein